MRLRCNRLKVQRAAAEVRPRLAPGRAATVGAARATGAANRAAGGGPQACIAAADERRRWHRHKPGCSESPETIAMAQPPLVVFFIIIVSHNKT